MTPPRFQFTIAGMLWATFWVAVACAVFWRPKSLSNFEIVFYRSIERKVYGLTMAEITGITAVFCLCAAIGALVGQQRKGLIVGLVLAGANFVIEVL